jgi:multiple sugar transport system permease protein
MASVPTEVDRAAATPGRARPPAGSSSRRPRGVGRNRHHGVFLTLPAVLVLAVTVGYPIVWLASLSLQSFSVSATAGPARFVGLANYARLFQAAAFRSALWHTVGFVAASLVLEALIALPIATALDRATHGRRVFQLLIALPLMVAPIVGGMAWRFLFSNGYGLINGLLSDVGVNGPSWLSSAWMARGSIMAANLWLALPFDILVLLAGLANLPQEPFEAVQIDGASRWQTFRYLTLPLLRPAILIIVVVRLADAFRIFDLVYILTGGGPANSTDVLSTYIYRLMFTDVDFAGGAAASTLLTLITMLVAALAVIGLRRKEA